MTRRLIIVGAGGFAREVAEIARRVAPERVLAVVDDAPSANALALMAAHGAEYLGRARDWAPAASDEAVLAIGDPATRALLDDLLTGRGARFTTLVHPDSTTAQSVRLGAGCVIAPGARLSVDVRVGRHVHIDQNATVGHDSVLGDHSRLNPMACVSGNVDIGARAYIGAAAAVLQGLSVGTGAVVGAGAVVTRSVPEGMTVKGVPAR